MTGFALVILWTGLPERVASQDIGNRAGAVKFFQLARSAFDPYTKDPTTEEQAWIREHYTAMQVWSPYFDSRLSWFPNGWFYKDCYAIYADGSVIKENPEWVLRDADDQMLFIPYACNDGTCPQFAADIGNPDFRAWWIAGAVETASRGYRGIWIDDVNLSWRVSNGRGETVIPLDPRTGNTMTLSNYQRYFAEFMEEVRIALPDITIAHNSLWFTDSPKFKNSYVARQIDAADFINLERGATDKGLKGGRGRYGFKTFLRFIDYVHGRGRNVILMDEAETLTEREFALASWLLISNGDDIFSTENLSWSSPDNWWAGYGLDLGDSVGSRYTWKRLLRRDFACGLVLVNPPGSSDVTVTLSGPHTDIDGRPVKNVFLPERNATILQTPCSRDSTAPSR